MPKSTVWNTIRNFFNTEITSDLPGSGHPRTTRTPKRIKAVKKKIGEIKKD